MFKNLVSTKYKGKVASYIRHLMNILESLLCNNSHVKVSRSSIDCALTWQLHCEFLEYWNTQKNVWRIWQHFSYLLDEGIPKIWKKLNSNDGFLSYLQNSTTNSAHLVAHFCPALVCPQKATVRIQFLPYFWNPHMK